MGIKISRGADLDIRLEKIAERSTRALRDVHRKGAHAMRDTAEEMVPFKTGELEGSVDVVETIETGNRKTFTVVAEASHAIYMHDGVYDLGKGSLEKQKSSRFTVGRKYMERAVAWLIRDWGLMEKSRAAVKQAKGKKR